MRRVTIELGIGMGSWKGGRECILASCIPFLYLVRILGPCANNLSDVFNFTEHTLTGVN